MTDETLTVPCEGIGVWEGARVVYTPTPRYQGSLRAPGEAGIVIAVERRDAAAWARVGFGADAESHPLRCLHLDLAHRPTRLEARVRLSERLGVPGIAMMRHHEGAWWVEHIDGTEQRAECAEFVDLDPTDDSCLPGGARVVDVRALAIVLRHVFRGAAP